MGPMGIYLLFGRNGREIGGMFDKGKQGLRGGAYWVGYVRVPNMDAAVATVKAERGKLLNGPMEVPGGDWIAQFSDPHGAFFAVLVNAADTKAASGSEAEGGEDGEDGGEEERKKNNSEEKSDEEDSDEEDSRARRSQEEEQEKDCEARCQEDEQKSRQEGARDGQESEEGLAPKDEAPLRRTNRRSAGNRSRAPARTISSSARSSALPRRSRRSRR